MRPLTLACQLAQYRFPSSRTPKTESDNLTDIKTVGCRACFLQGSKSGKPDLQNSVEYQTWQFPPKLGNSRRNLALPSFPANLALPSFSKLGTAKFHDRRADNTHTKARLILVCMKNIKQDNTHTKKHDLFSYVVCRRI
jgi:hypothetical protein